MSNLARKLQQEKQYEQQIKGQAIKPKKEKNFWLTPGEKVIGLLFGAVVCFGAVQMISAQASIYEINKDIQTINTSIGEQQKVNNDLKMQVSELSTYERIWEKARKLGLNLNENNVKVVQD
ncbi:cell division protein FtsL [Bacillus sp. CGMCC 1.16607]|uniref:cell division protein FtsL n=1 Tax=Bacillus sp. CGMCC 1.16607 TaxID=3351842 RepID=UPI003632812E